MNKKPLDFIKIHFYVFKELSITCQKLLYVKLLTFLIEKDITKSILKIYSIQVNYLSKFPQ